MSAHDNASHDILSTGGVHGHIRLGNEISRRGGSMSGRLLKMYE